ncbi:ATP-grasp domain-containing protein [Natranaerobius thermophilus]|uniref:ATP-grasp domain-containing protein n=1 Tax=Natranaerobius thermophilus (strain ATCC BAA-1301 / DSM 18059 / JW/NM-WN-LF) TaxID=457570 RepID=B2A5T6_NATTJ|nr:ATP-grasp domain-containing protein [Natranaerobius thermophilus]ACB84029.1 hypothetical protein Nther_0433 [Natranaerobius thermophilus JW/NM-WN-LF]
MSKKFNVLILCGEKEVPIIQENIKYLENYNVETETSDKILQMGTQKYLEEMIELLNQEPERYHGIIGTRDMTSVFANVIAEKTGKMCTSVESMINCQNKYISRKLQQKYVPEATPRFWLDSYFLKEFPIKPPYFVKPVRANMSYSSKKLNSYDDLRELIKDRTQELTSYNKYYLDAIHVASHLKNQENLDTCNKFICEELIPGEQVTVNGYIFQGKVKIYGLVKAAFWDEKISFSHHEYPYELPEELDTKVKNVVEQAVKGLGLDNTFFNVELRIDQDKKQVYIIEVNSRMAFQFAKMIESVEGVNLVKSLCDLAVGKQPDEEQTNIERRYKYCFNFELREFADRNIVRIPMERNLKEINELYPEVTVKNLVDANSKLSDYKQNLESFRYAIIDVPGNSRDEIMEKYRDIKSRLGYEFDSELKEAN